jgi:hypothetical protein
MRLTSKVALCASVLATCGSAAQAQYVAAGYCISEYASWSGMPPARISFEPDQGNPDAYGVAYIGRSDTPAKILKVALDGTVTEFSTSAIGDPDAMLHYTGGTADQVVSDGELIVGSAGGNIWRVSSTGVVTALVSSSSLFSNPEDFVLVSDGRVFFTDADDSTKGLYEISETGGTVSVSRLVSSPAKLKHLAIRESGSSIELFASGQDGKVYGYDGSGDPLISGSNGVFIDEGWPATHHPVVVSPIYIDSSEALFVLGNGINRVVEDSSGEPERLVTIGGELVFVVQDITFGRYGDLFVVADDPSSTTNKIYRIQTLVGDINADGTVGLGDLGALNANYNSSCD